MTELPELDSDLIELALADLARCAEDPAYEVDMRQWHEPNLTTGQCHVCLAGALLAGTLRVPADKIVVTYMHVVPHRERLYRLNDYRRGWDPDDELLLPDVTPWSKDPDAFVADMHKVADALREAGR